MACVRSPLPSAWRASLIRLNNWLSLGAFILPCATERPRLCHLQRLLRLPGAAGTSAARGGPVPGFVPRAPRAGIAISGGIEALVLRFLR